MGPTDTPEWALELNSQLKMLNKMTRLQLNATRFGNLGPERILTINHQGRAFDLHLPFGDNDYIQRKILNDRGFYEANLLQSLLEMNVVQHGGVIIDAGSNIGNHAVFFGGYFAPKRMYCFEPQDIAYATMVRNIELNLAGSDVRAHQSMLGATSGRGGVAAYKHGNHGGASFEASDTGGTQMVSLDEAIEPADVAAVSFIKIDVEGYQGEVIRGATQILSQSKPVLWIEVFANEKAETDELLTKFGYRAQKLSQNNYIYSVAAG
ncbi:FkbM family methyltransferase [Octadecabacter sp. G9-8]|uniref:FkbM family methyltransferase n=1 Tax=Octadecabacter dasysiphoniae TaxID=2909341 RepID=A0ABS9D0B6_9RHOB|nr:FkbM family methyltransferase [Octadecabacter dasysiphoniae]MCF2872961.1 FkbM family methyltransferase [Octadecabacter dasysiphoniae]